MTPFMTNPSLMTPVYDKTDKTGKTRTQTRLEMTKLTKPENTENTENTEKPVISVFNPLSFLMGPRVGVFGVFYVNS